MVESNSTKDDRPHTSAALFLFSEKQQSGSSNVVTHVEGRRNISGSGADGSPTVIHLPPSELLNAASPLVERVSKTSWDPSASKLSLSNDSFTTFHPVGSYYPERVGLICECSPPREAVRVFTSAQGLMQHIIDQHSASFPESFFCPLASCRYSSKAVLLKEPCYLFSHVSEACRTTRNAEVVVLTPHEKTPSGCDAALHLRKLKIFLGFPSLLAPSGHITMGHTPAGDFDPNTDSRFTCWNYGGDLIVRRPFASGNPVWHAKSSLLCSIVSHPQAYCRCKMHTSVCTENATVNTYPICIGCKWIFPWLQPRTAAYIIDQLREKTTVTRSLDQLLEWMMELSRMKIDSSHQQLHGPCGSQVRSGTLVQQSISAATEDAPSA